MQEDGGCDGRKIKMMGSAAWNFVRFHYCRGFKVGLNLRSPPTTICGATVSRNPAIEDFEKEIRIAKSWNANGPS